MNFLLLVKLENNCLSLLNLIFPAAGLAAPQIGIGKSVFIYSYDRDPKNLEVAINPSYIPIGDGKSHRMGRMPFRHHDDLQNGLSSSI